MQDRLSKSLPLVFADSFTFGVKKARFIGGGERTIEFHKDPSVKWFRMTPKGKVAKVAVGQGLPANTSESRV